MTAVLIIIALVCVLMWKFINFALAGVIYLIRGGKYSMAHCEDTARGVLGGIIAVFVVLALIL